MAQEVIHLFLKKFSKITEMRAVCFSFLKGVDIPQIRFVLLLEMRLSLRLRNLHEDTYRCTS